MIRADTGGQRSPLIGIECGCQLAIEIIDIGVPGETIDAVFEPFFQGDMSISRAQGGTGLGLTIARQLSDLLGGTLVVESRFGAGSLFTLELSVAAAALDRNLPILAICRGIQVLNVARGGTLYQDIPGLVSDAILHSQKADKSVQTHAVRVEPGSVLRGILKRAEIWVNSKHHQSVKDVAPGFRVSARAADGVIEAMEDPDRSFVLGVQWHPEGTFGTDRNSKKLFKALVNKSGQEAG